MTWQPERYLRFGDYRTRPAADLLARVPLERAELIYDLGCGPGNSTELLVERWPDARVVGVDSSGEMLAAARASGVDAEWVEQSIEAFAPNEPADLVYSNAALHWVEDHAALVPRLVQFVRDGGVFAAQMPHRLPGQAFVTAVHETANDGPWAERFTELPWGLPGPRPEDYYAYLTEDADPRARMVDVWVTEYLHALEGEDAVLNWTRSTALRPFLEKLSETEQKDFLHGYRRRLAKAYPVRKSGVTLFPFARIFVVAVR